MCIRCPSLQFSTDNCCALVCSGRKRGAFSLQKCKYRSFENAGKHTSDRHFGVQQTRQLAPHKHEQRKPLAEPTNMMCRSRRMSLTAEGRWLRATLPTFSAQTNFSSALSLVVCGEILDQRPGASRGGFCPDKKTRVVRGTRFPFGRSAHASRG